MSPIPLIILFLPFGAGSLVRNVWDWTHEGLALDENDGEVEKSKRQADTGLGYVPVCKEGYEMVDGSTMCLVDSPKYIEGTAGVSETEIEIILEEHNKYRAAVYPPAKEMRKLYWDEELAMLAEKWAKQCVVGHETGNGRYIPKYNIVPGQNGGYQMNNWKSVIKSWFRESDLFRYGEEPASYLGYNGGTKIGQYSTMSVDKISRIGCGYAKCITGARDYYFCNYIPGPTLVPFPYRIGLPCDTCVKNCSRNLCDCGPVFCFNGGTLDMARCECDCAFPFSGSDCLIDPCPGRRCKQDGILDTDSCTCTCAYPYTGELCEIVSCDSRPDGESCTTTDKDHCVYKSVERSCPILCGICPELCPDLDCEDGVIDISSCECTYPCGNMACMNNGVLDQNSCKCTCTYPYAGDTCEIKQCTGKLDVDLCKIYWPKYLCNFPPVEKYCPVMCGVCEDPCPQRECQNNGILTKDCTCLCHYPFSGAECQTKNCKNKLDQKECGLLWPESFCERFSNLPINCPNLCGVCPAPCNGKLCQNNGTLNVGTCECVCHENYTGEFCETEKCGGKVCFNYGTLDFDTCYCHCPPNHTGDCCEEWACPEDDPSDCGGSSMPSYQCLTQWDVPFICPFMCGRCPRK